MEAQRHVIKRLVVEVSAPTSACDATLTEEISRLVRNRLTESIGSVCDSVLEPDTLHRIDVLEIDAGRIPLRDLEASLVPAITAAFRVQLEEAIRSDAGGERPSRVRSSLEVVDVFARTGVFPWWVDEGRPGRLQAALSSLLAEAPDELIGLLGQLAREPNAVRRLVLVLEDDDLTRVMGLRGLNAWLTDGMRSLPGLLAKSPMGHGIPAERLRGVVWREGLRWVAQGVGEGSGAGAVVVVLTRVAELLGSTAVNILDVVAAGAGGGRAEEPWMAAWREAFRTPNAPGAHELESVTRRLSNSGAWHAPLIRAIAGAWRAARGEAVAGWLRRVEPLEGQGLSREREEALLLSLVEHARSVAGIDPAALARVAEAGSEAFRAGVGELLKDSGAREAPGKTEKDTARTSDNEAGRLPGVSEGFSEADEVYVGNAGLVILGPFLERFFRHRGLWEKGGFVDEAARHRAAGLLQHLVTETEAPEEASISLNKVLCGMEPAEVFDFGGLVTAEEREESARLLTAVIGHAPILHRMSLRGFRGSFLLRAGQLSVRDDRWLLRVERETYDVVMDRFPWSFRWIRLPWMTAPLEVEW